MAKKTSRKPRNQSRKAGHTKAKAPKLDPATRQKINALIAKGLECHRRKALAQAEQCYRSVLQIDPGHSDANQFLALIARDSGQIPAAVILLKRAIERDSGNEKLLFLLAQLYEKLGEYPNAEECYRHSIDLNPRFLEALNNLGLLYKTMHRYGEACDCFEKVLCFQPRSARTLSNLGNCQKESGQLYAAISTLRKSVAFEPKLLGAHSNLLLALNYLEESDPDTLFAEHRKWGRKSGIFSFENHYDFSGRAADHSSDKPLRIGFVSADLHRHSVAFFFEPLLRELDPDRFFTICYYNHHRQDEVQQRIKSLSGLWRQVGQLSDASLADQIYEDQVDILVDLSGHSAHNRLPVLVRKPAPTQITWLGYPNTTGLDTVDYRISDAIADLPGKADAVCSEKLIRLESGFLCYQGDSTLPNPSPAPFIDNGYVTFGSCNSAVKITDRQIERWAGILKALPSAKLLLKAPQFGDALNRERFQALFGAQNIDADRIELHGMIPGYADHMAFYDKIDVALDTFPYNGTTTTFEALWMGVPTLTLSGETHASRVGASILGQVGLDDFIAVNAADYLDKAIQLADDPESLNRIRQSLRVRLNESSLCDARGFAEKMADVFRRVSVKG